MRLNKIAEDVRSVVIDVRVKSDEKLVLGNRQSFVYVWHSS
jgi:hypothetical protein